MREASSNKTTSGLSKNRVFLIIKMIAADDLKSLIKFLKSPYFNQSKTLAELGQVFINLRIKGEIGFNKELVWRKIYPKKPYNDINFRKACSDLLNLVETFMSTEIYYKDNDRVFIDKIEFIKNNNITPLLDRAIFEKKELFKLKKYRTLNDYYNAYKLEQTYYHLMDFDTKIEKNINIEKISDNLDVFYLIDKLKLHCTAHSKNYFSAVEYDLNNVNSVLNLCNKFDFSNYPELGIYYYSYQTLTDNDNTEHYYNLKIILENYAHLIPQSDAIEIFDTALNYCIRRVNRGFSEFLPEYFDLLLKSIELRVFVVNGILATVRFNNMVVVGLRLGKLEWADQFVEKNKILLDPSVRQNIVKFNLARINLYKKEYEKVLFYIRDVEYEDIINNLTSKIMICISYYELDEYNTLDSFIEAFRTFLNRQKEIQTGIKQSHLHFLKFLRQLMRKTTKNETETEAIRNNILNVKPAPVNREWLLDKLQELQ